MYSYTRTLNLFLSNIIKKLVNSKEYQYFKVKVLDEFRG